MVQKDYYRNDVVSEGDIMPLTFTQLAIDVIRAENRAMAPNEIWEKATELGLTEQLISRGQTPIKTLRTCSHSRLRSKWA